MNITFHGAAQSVTGSCFLVQAHGCGFLIDCSMAQGGREADEHNQQAFAFDAADLDLVVLTHAHIDHSGLLPKLVAQGFKGSVYATLATRDLHEVLLKDSARLQMMDAERAARREHQQAVPLYSPAHVASTLEQVQARPYGHSFEPVAARG
ncbi:Ribonuclease [Comamonas sp. PE63]|uniref:Ribonuclease n=1 Tax=Comamonas brasiliensis TaxID=1812482 RepID=A0ABS5LQ20_9BURK|nr:MBL fold metallo-hydrolase [Comamonas sp. PE63]MBS3018187.1 Ribonuclease [Comamonas sp. PE63]